MSTDALQLAAELGQNDAHRRQAAAERLATMAEEAAPAAVVLVSASGDEDDVVREWAVSALEGMGPPPESALPELVTLLDAEHSDVIYWAATLLGRLEDRAADASAALSAAAAKVENAAAKKRIAWALGKTQQ